MTKAMFPLRVSAVLLLGLPLLACDTEDDPEIQAEAQAVANEVPDDLLDEALEVPEEGEGLVGDESRTDAFAAELEPLSFTFLPPHSEETPGTSPCPVNQVVTGFSCSGSYCDNVAIECHSYGTSVPAISNGFSGWFEVGQPWGTASGVPSKQLHVCDSDEKMTGIDCRGSHCDDIKIECSPAPGLGTARCEWTDKFSEEDPGFLAPIGSAIQGVWCSGQHCDDKRYFVCEV